MKKLIIVESPAKAGTIKKFLGSNYDVVASKGHIRDLPKSRLGVDIEDMFEPEYINVRGKAPLINDLKKRAKDAEKVFLATDPDREGEAIAWHLAIILGIPLDSECRITFNEITKEAVKKAVKNPRKIDMDLVDAQQARRVLDRIVGYKISPLLWKNVRSGLSAGRVQTVALKLIVDREKEIRNFKPEEYWTINAILAKDNIEFNSKFYGKDSKKIELHSEKEVENIIKSLDKKKFEVVDIKEGTRKKNPTPPFTTSTLQQTASRNINFNIRKTMQVAQKLYEGIKIPGKGITGLITYMRTDSTRISDEARAKAKEIITEKYGAKYYENRFFKTGKNSQDGHEAIRPAYPDIAPNDIKEYLSNDEYKLYSLIYNRFLASQMASALYETVAIKIENNSYEFRTNGSILKFDGFLKLYGVEIYNEDSKRQNKEEGNEEQDENNNLPKLKVGDIPNFVKYDNVQSFTEPPARYTEATLVKKLEENGIGRPSTYAPTISTIQTRNYIEREKRQLVPTELGELVEELLEKYFEEIFNVEFTKEIEEDFDIVAEGDKEWKEILSNFYNPFSKSLKVASKELEKIEIEEEKSDEICEVCGKPMVYKHGRFGKFLACSGYPECKNTKRIVNYTGDICPKCGGRIEARKSKRRTNYYICENNPKNNCDYISWNRPGEEEKNKKSTKGKTKKTTKTTKTTKAKTKKSKKNTSTKSKKK